MKLLQKKMDHSNVNLVQDVKNTNPSIFENNSRLNSTWEQTSTSLAGETLLTDTVMSTLREYADACADDCTTMIGGIHSRDIINTIINHFTENEIDLSGSTDGVNDKLQLSNVSSSQICGTLQTATSSSSGNVSLSNLNLPLVKTSECSTLLPISSPIIKPNVELNAATDNAVDDDKLNYDDSVISVPPYVIEHELSLMASSDLDVGEDSRAQLSDFEVVDEANISSSSNDSLVELEMKMKQLKKELSQLATNEKQSHEKKGSHKTNSKDTSKKMDEKDSTTKSKLSHKAKSLVISMSDSTISVRQSKSIVTRSAEKSETAKKQINEEVKKLGDGRQKNTTASSKVLHKDIEKVMLSDKGSQKKRDSSASAEDLTYSLGKEEARLTRSNSNATRDKRVTRERSKNPSPYSKIEDQKLYNRRSRSKSCDKRGDSMQTRKSSSRSNDRQQLQSEKTIKSLSLHRNADKSSSDYRNADKSLCDSKNADTLMSESRDSLKSKSKSKNVDKSRSESRNTDISLPESVNTDKFLPESGKTSKDRSSSQKINASSNMLCEDSLNVSKTNCSNSAAKIKDDEVKKSKLSEQPTKHSKTSCEAISFDRPTEKFENDKALTKSPVNKCVGEELQDINYSLANKNDYLLDSNLTDFTPQDGTSFIRSTSRTSSKTMAKPSVTITENLSNMFSTYKPLVDVAKANQLPALVSAPYSPDESSCVILTRHVNQLFIRGDNVVMVTFADQ